MSSSSPLWGVADRRNDTDNRHRRVPRSAEAGLQRTTFCPEHSSLSENERFGVPRQAFLQVWPQSVLSVHLLGFASFLGRIGSASGDVKLQDDGVVHDPVNRRGGGHGVGKDASYSEKTKLDVMPSYLR